MSKKTKTAAASKRLTTKTQTSANRVTATPDLGAVRKKNLANKLTPADLSQEMERDAWAVVLTDEAGDAHFYTTFDNLPDAFGEMKYLLSERIFLGHIDEDDFQSVAITRVSAADVARAAIGLAANKRTGKAA
jgi:hypothetical protein